MVARLYGAFTDREAPGFHVVALESVDGSVPTIELIHVPEWQLEGRRLTIGYVLLVEDVSDESARSLISDALLDGFYQGDHGADEVTLVNRVTGARTTVAAGGGSR